MPQGCGSADLWRVIFCLCYSFRNNVHGMSLLPLCSQAYLPRWKTIHPEQLSDLWRRCHNGYGMPLATFCFWILLGSWSDTAGLYGFVLAIQVMKSLTRPSQSMKPDLPWRLRLIFRTSFQRLALHDKQVSHTFPPRPTTADTGREYLGHSRVTTMCLKMFILFSCRCVGSVYG